MIRISKPAALLGFFALAAPSIAQPLPGQIVRDPAHPAWLKLHDGGSFYMCGPGDPEDFLYRGTRNANGTRNGDQAALIQKLIGTGANCIYLQAVRSHGGDGDATHNPFIGGNPASGLNTAILDQWETWFTLMDDNGITIFLFLYDDSSSPYGSDLPAGGQLKTEEAAFIDGLVARFKHHRRLIWCVAEEYGEALTPAHAVKIAQRLRQQDNRQHLVAIHQNSSTSFDFNGNPSFDQFAVQWNVNTAAQLHAGAVAAWTQTSGLVNINLSEFANAGSGATLRQKLWAIAMGGASSMVLGMDIASTPVSDLQACGQLVSFMQATRCNETSPHDELARAGTDYVLANPGEVYLAYADSGTTLGLNMQAGHYTVKWHDAIAGAWFDSGAMILADGDQSFTRPGTVGEEAVLYLDRVRTPPAAASAPNPPSGATQVSRSPLLGWVAGPTALSHDVYLGTSSPGVYQGNQGSTSFSASALQPNTTYYWRVDAMNGSGTTTGSVWSFTTQNQPADFDGDGDVDQADFGRFQVCLTSGPAQPISPACDAANLNQDDIVDVDDFQLFLGCLSGPNVPANPSCAGP